MTRQRIANHLVGAIVAIALFAPLFWMLLDREPPFEMLYGMISPERVRPGGKIIVTWGVKVLRNCPASPNGTVTRTLTDSTGRHFYETVHAVYDSKAPDPTIERAVDIPLLMAPGLATYSSVACYPCNPLQQHVAPICVRMPPSGDGLRFEVVSPHEQN